MVRNLRDHLLDLNMDILDNRNITSKHLGRKGLHLNKAGSTRLAKNIIHKLRKFWRYLEHLNESPARVSISSNISRSPISMILACPLPFLLFLLNFYLPLYTAINLSKTGENKSTAWSPMYSGRKSVTKVDSFPPIFERIEFP